MHHLEPKPFCHVGEGPPFLVSGHSNFSLMQMVISQVPEAEAERNAKQPTSKGHESFGHSGWVVYGATSERNGIKQVPPFLRGWLEVWKMDIL